MLSPQVGQVPEGRCFALLPPRLSKESFAPASSSPCLSPRLLCLLHRCVDASPASTFAGTSLPSCSARVCILPQGCGPVFASMLRTLCRCSRHLLPVWSRRSRSLLPLLPGLSAKGGSELHILQVLLCICPLPATSSWLFFWLSGCTSGKTHTHHERAVGACSPTSSFFVL